jgi:hypothetical protein
MRTYVGWPARSVRSLRYHGTVLCLADSAANFTTSRFSIAPPPCGTCYSAPNICSLLPEGCSHRTASATDGATAGSALLVFHRATTATATAGRRPATG